MNQRVIFNSASDRILNLQTLTGEEIKLICSDEQFLHWNKLKHLIHTGNVLQLVHVHDLDTHSVSCEFIILEPNYLMDISSLAECYRPFGDHPLNYTLSRLRIPVNTRHILLGNTANYFIDTLVHEKDGQQIDYRQLLTELFRSSPFEFTACEDLQDPDTERHFFEACRLQYNHIRQIVKEKFPSAGIDRDKVILEPAFISNVLGLQGRLDLMLQDFSAFVELKSGKAEDDFRTGTFIHSSIHHYTQMILYLAVLEVNLNLSPEEVRSYLLYSKYPVLSLEKHSRKHLDEVLHLRNCIVALEDVIQRKNSIAATENILKHISPRVLNVKKLTGNFFEKYLQPQIEECRQMIDVLTEQERAYFMRIYAFIVKEMWIAKAGERDYEGSRKAANMWNVPVEEKIAAGEFLYDLRIICHEAAGEKHFIVLEIPVYPDNYLPNFRQGDAIVLYQACGPDGIRRTVNETQVFKGAIETMSAGKIKIRLRAPQRNTTVLPLDSLYAIEHDYMDAVFTGMFKGLTAFAQANKDRRDLLLGLRQPRFRENDTHLSHTPSDDIHRIVWKALAAEDCFLLIGPPGTGKTSRALKEIVSVFLENSADEQKEFPKNILLLSYTNRAVDEMCKALLDMDRKVPFIRVGSELNCDPSYRPYLLDNILNSCQRRDDVRNKINNSRILIGTVASVWSKPDLFRLKHFDLAVVDEATQLLEPHLLGIFSIKNSDGRDAVERFVLIGDHKQLPAVILQSKEDSEVKEPVLREMGFDNLSNSLFERLYRQYVQAGLTHAFDMLNKQGRMHPSIAQFPSYYFYEGKLDIAGLPHQQEDTTAPFLFPERVMFFPSSRSPEDVIDKINHEEARLAATISRDLYLCYEASASVFDPQALGIITPYRSQIALIKKEIELLDIPSLSQVVVDTVERFQGSQKDIIIYSFCINTDWQLQALPNLMEENGNIIDRKLNVVLTRARKQLIILGNPVFLSKNILYKKLIDHFSTTYKT